MEKPNDSSPSSILHSPSSLSSQAGLLALNAATFLWGTTFVVTKQVIAGCPPAVLMLGRFCVAAVLLSPLLRGSRQLGARLWLAAAELGALLWLGYVTQTIGQQYTSVSRCAFITSLHVILVPMLAAIRGHVSKPSIWIAAVMALAGVGFLSYDGSPPNRGDAWTLACAVTWAFYIVRLEKHARLIPTKSLTAAHLLVVALLCGVWAFFDPATTFHLEPKAWLAIAYLGVAGTAVTTWLQTVGQSKVSAPRAAVIYTLEPVWAAMFGWLILQERFGPRGWTGAGLIVLAAMLAAIPPRTASN